jgi:hypothetical protein
MEEGSVIAVILAVLVTIYLWSTFHFEPEKYENQPFDTTNEASVYVNE